MASKNVVMIGAGVANVNAATKLVDNGFKGKITIIDMGKDPYLRPYEEVMTGFLGAGGWSDGKLTYHTAIGGQLSKYCGEEKAMELFDQVIDNFKRFHPKPEEVQCSNPIAEPDFIKPYFGLRLFPVWHVGTDYLHEIGKNWYDFLVDGGVEFICMNTDTQDLHQSKADKKIHIGKNLTKGLGSGMNPEIGKQAAEETQAEVQEVLKGSDLVFIAGGMGGGTGTGAAPIIARAAKEQGILTVAVVTKPFFFEGDQRGQIAKLCRSHCNFNARIRTIFHVVRKIYSRFSTTTKSNGFPKIFKFLLFYSVSNYYSRIICHCSLWISLLPITIFTF